MARQLEFGFHKTGIVPFFDTLDESSKEELLEAMAAIIIKRSHEGEIDHES